MWQEAQKRDEALPTGYAGTNLAEDFAEIGRVSLTNRVMPGGLAALNGNVDQFKNQLDLYEQSFSGLIYPAEGRCIDKVKSAPAVDVSGSLRIRQMLGLGDKPDVSLPEGVKERVVSKRSTGEKRVEDWFDHKH